MRLVLEISSVQKSFNQTPSLELESTTYKLWIKMYFYINKMQAEIVGLMVWLNGNLSI
jgi:hypothetical protein